ncbi:hypothetical protein HK097_004634, partial [Rhizophlyctis rosea]
MLDTFNCRVIALDQDPHAFARAEKLSEEEQYRGRVLPVFGKFGDLPNLIKEQLDLSGACIDGILFDIGVSSNQLDDGSRGFSLRFDGPLDMRMASPGGNSQISKRLKRTLTAEAIVNGFPEEELGNIILKYGEEKSWRKIARAIVEAREYGAIETTHQLADIIADATGRNWKRGEGTQGIVKSHPAVRTFQSLRIYINDELNELRKGLHAAEVLLKPGGRCIVVTFHSLEDRIAKRFFKHTSGTESGLQVSDWAEWEKENVMSRKKNGREKERDDGDGELGELEGGLKALEKEQLRDRYHRRTRNAMKEE